MAISVVRCRCAHDRKLLSACAWNVDPALRCPKIVLPNERIISISLFAFFFVWCVFAHFRFSFRINTKCILFTIIATGWQTQTINSSKAPQEIAFSHIDCDNLRGQSETRAGNTNGNQRRKKKPTWISLALVNNYITLADGWTQRIPRFRGQNAWISSCATVAAVAAHTRSADARSPCARVCSLKGPPLAATAQCTTSKYIINIGFFGCNEKGAQFFLPKKEEEYQVIWGNLHA